MKNLFVLFLLFTNSILANTTVNDNRFLIHTDKPFYTTGEVIWYKLYMPPAFKNKTLAVKGLLVGPNGEVTERFFHKAVERSYIDGHLKIPYNYSSGVYQLVFKSNIASTDQEIILTQIAVPIYNDLEPDLSAKTTASPTSTTNASNPEDALKDLKIEINLAKNVYSVREAIEGDIQITDANRDPVTAQLSISVIDQQLMDAGGSYYSFAEQGAALTADQLNNLSNSVYLKGRVFDNSGTPIKVNVFGAYASKLNKIQYGKSNDDGFFTLELPDFYQKQTIQFLPFEKEQTDIAIKILPDAENLSTGQQLILNPILTDYLESSQLRKKMSPYFDNLDPKADLQPFVDEVASLEPDLSYDISQYVKFDRIYDFFAELITPLQFKKEKGKYVASMNNPSTRYAVLSKLKGNPLFIIDGKATRDANFSAQLSMSNVETIELFFVPEKLRKQFNVLGNSGVVKVNTKIPQFDLPEPDKEDLFEIDGLQQVGNFIPFTPNQASQELPHFFTTIYWEPNLQTRNNGIADLSFYHGDDRGTFTIIVVAQDENGNQSVATQNYSVER